MLLDVDGALCLPGKTQYGQLRVACHGQMVVVIIFQEHRNYNTVSAYIAVMLILYKQPCVMSGSTDAMA
jgi:hypothetical protein